MFKSLRTGTKLLLLCSVFVGALVVANYGLVSEKQIAIHFVRKELVGVRHLELLRDVYALIMQQNMSAAPSETDRNAIGEALNRLAATRAVDFEQLDTTELEGALAEAIDKLASAKSGERQVSFVSELTRARDLASRIGDDSNLTLDPDLDSYYVQDIVVAKIPALLSEIGELQSHLDIPSFASSAPETIAVRALVLDGTIRSNLEAIERDLRASYRGGSGSRLRQSLNADLAAMLLAWSAYLDAVKKSLDGPREAGTLDNRYAAAVDSAIHAWTESLVELKQLLDLRLSNLLIKLRRSLVLNGLLVALSLAFAFMTGRYIVQPLRKLERLADEVAQTKDYRLRTDYESRDEIGRLAAAFNVMLTELAQAREREASDAARRAAMQTELARVARITTMGEMAASIAHEINQPLAAIANNANASLRWLGRNPPNVERARSVLERVVSDAGRASEVIRSIRGMLAKGSQERTQLDVNDVIREVMTFIWSDLRHHGITVRSELADNLPLVSAVRIQLQQVLLNLIANAVDSMTSAERRVLTIRSLNANDSGILIAVEDTGTGIDQDNLERVFGPFFSTKPEGMGMGLSICRSIIEAHGGRITASPSQDGGSLFQIGLPTDDPSQFA